MGKLKLIIKVNNFLQILDLYFELFENFDPELVDPLNKKDGIQIVVTDPGNNVIETILVAGETHKSY